jgi:hypothetical protein
VSPFYWFGPIKKMMCTQNKYYFDTHETKLPCKYGITKKLMVTNEIFGLGFAQVSQDSVATHLELQWVQFSASISLHSVELVVTTHKVSQTFTCELLTHSWVKIFIVNEFSWQCLSRDPSQNSINHLKINFNLKINQYQVIYECF